ncbi:MAG: peptidase E [Gammaproteobacteria bacterium]|nr:peptidase E [Gammaproteobacteria bacterium]
MVKPPREPQTLAIDREIVRQARCKRPRLLFIPTASIDDPAYVDAIHDLYGQRLGCRVSELLLYRDRPDRKTMRRMILDSDIIYVGGGNTLRMMKLWRRLGVNGWLDQARRQGTVLCGLSAGAICWFRQGNSDSRKFSNEQDKTLIRVTGLGFADLLLCPHYDVEKHRQPALKAMMQKTPGIAVALENCTAIEIIDERYRVLRSVNNRNAWCVFWRRGEYFREKLPMDGRFRSLQGLLQPVR